MMRAFNNLPLELGGNHDIRLIGPRKSGKTTYMAALARWPNADPNSPIEAVDPFDTPSAELIDLAQDILEDGRELAGTDYAIDADELATYTLLITLKPNLFNHPRAKLQGKSIRLQVSCREYSGELIKDLRNINTSRVDLNSYLDDCASANGLMLLLDGSAKADKEYAQAFKNLQQELNDRLSVSNQRRQDYRIAVVFAKCEQAGVWIYRQDAKKFIGLKFPATKGVLQQWRRLWGCQINYFFCSAFGTKGEPPRPNVRVLRRNRGGIDGVIDKPNLWKPMGLVAPLYWLQTGQEDARLRDL
ncbi:MAG: hypothetical protein F6K47_29570 [Symploca sp. SIO2E6]|nr:hypothetical protein [Symploca sp. SIO2E6]